MKDGKIVVYKIIVGNVKLYSFARIGIYSAGNCHFCIHIFEKADAVGRMHI